MLRMCSVELLVPLGPPLYRFIEFTGMQSSSVEVALVLRRLAEGLESGNATSVQLAKTLPLQVAWHASREIVPLNAEGQ